MTNLLQERIASAISAPTPDGYAALYPSYKESIHPHTVGRVKEQRDVPVTTQLHKRPSRIQCAPTLTDRPVINLLQEQTASAISVPIPDGYATLYPSYKMPTHPYSVGRVKEQRDVPVTTHSIHRYRKIPATSQPGNRERIPCPAVSYDVAQRMMPARHPWVP